MSQLVLSESLDVPVVPVIYVDSDSPRLTRTRSYSLPPGGDAFKMQLRPRARSPNYHQLQVSSWTYYDLIVVYFAQPAAWRSVGITFFPQSNPTAFSLMMYMSPCASSKITRSPIGALR